MREIDFTTRKLPKSVWRPYPRWSVMIGDGILNSAITLNFCPEKILQYNIYRDDRYQLADRPLRRKQLNGWLKSSAVAGQVYIREDSYQNYQYVFERSADAMLFKLIWG